MPGLRVSASAAGAVLDKGSGDRGELAAVEGGDAEAATAAGRLGTEKDAAAAGVVLGPPEDDNINLSPDAVGVDGNSLGGRRSLGRCQDNHLQRQLLATERGMAMEEGGGPGRCLKVLRALEGQAPRGKAFEQGLDPM